LLLLILLSSLYRDRKRPTGLESFGDCEKGGVVKKTSSSSSCF